MATDLLTTAEAQAVLGLGTLTAKQGTVLGLAITAVSDKLAQVAGTIAYGSITAEAHHGGRSYIYLDHQPVAVVSQVVEYTGTTAATLTAQTNSAQTANDYLVNLANGRITRRNTNFDACFPAGRNNVTVTYVAGRVAGGTLAAARFRLAASLTLKSAWRAWEDSAAQVGEFEIPQNTFPRFLIPNAAKELLADEWRGGSGVGD